MTLYQRKNSLPSWLTLWSPATLVKHLFRNPVQPSSTLTQTLAMHAALKACSRELAVTAHSTQPVQIYSLLRQSIMQIQIIVYKRRHLYASQFMASLGNGLVFSTCVQVIGNWW